MSQPPSTPVKVPSAAVNNTPATLDPDLRSQINSLLLRDGHVAKIQESLLHALNSNSTNWPTLIQAHALSLLRSGEITTYPALLRRVLEDVREASSNSVRNGSKSNGDALSKKVNGTVAPFEKPNLAMPESVIDEALRVTRESLEAVCEIDGETGS
ncbi:hypothetical protein E4U43_004341 [Claviceps pusilla]|uniref:Uncharacterized protein n=1 Tax=Claviceps pusilla TaxID=123648 RepID=A0A9P7T0B5_9HYPO|nr:hypothetical protein E4U43_004341 [Claviceps pusilla]